MQIILALIVFIPDILRWQNEILIQDKKSAVNLYVYCKKSQQNILISLDYSSTFLYVMLNASSKMCKIFWT
jgi:hypothetical protein